MRVAERATPTHNLEALTIPASPAARKSAATSELPPPKGQHPRVFKTSAPDLTPIDGDVARQVLDSLATYAETLQPERRHFLGQFTPLDVAFKVVGTGSVGLRDYCVYMQGNGAKDPLFLQVKEEVHSAYTPYLGESPSHQGRRVVEGQRAMQFQSDPFLGWTTIEGRDFLVRQLNDHKAAIALSELNIKPAALLEYAALCGETLARGHARSGDAAMIAGYIGTSARFDAAIAHFAVEYAAQTERDWQALVRSRRHAIAKPHKPAKRAPRKSK
jgi:uncharacterized protein (DUF2252 family)